MELAIKTQKQAIKYKNNLRNTEFPQDKLTKK